MTPGDRTPAAVPTGTPDPARLTERDLAAYEDRQRGTRAEATEVGIPADRYDGGLSVAETEAVLAALRAAWAERDELRASFLELFETTRRYRTALERIAYGVWTREWSPSSSGKSGVARAALAAPGASGQATEERTT